MTTIKSLILICVLNASFVNAQEMKKVKLSNGDEVYSMSEREQANVKNSLASFKELRRDTIQDLIYKSKPIVFALYRTQDGKLLFDYGQVKFLILSQERTYDYYLDNERYYQTIHSMDFIDLKMCKDFIANIDELVILFCKRRNIERNKLTLKHLKEDIAMQRSQAASFLKEQIAVMCFLNEKVGYVTECLQVFGSDELCSISMVNKSGNRITPSQLVSKIYEDKKTR